MRIACLQFDPQVADVDNNLNRADAVLDKANQEDLDGLDLLVLPELAFTGYNFKSLQHIAPFLEEAGPGITSLWAQTTALKHDCAVVAGYPEKVDVSANWPASPEYYNSALVVNGDGDTVGNYRKSFLYYTDETWALEGGKGFFKGEIPRLGNVALGICTDLNPYKLEAPWDAFEFGFHVMKAQANVVIMSMAWQTHQDPSSFNVDPAEPDLETLVYWVQRLEPLIRADKEEEVIVVFCNRTGSEAEATYTGTSAVIGIKRSEVFVYGILGRGVNDLLVVDTDQPPKCKLTDADAVGGDEYPADNTTSNTKIAARPTVQIPATPTAEHQDCPCYLTESGHGLPSPQQPTSPRLPWLAQPAQPSSTPTDARSPTRLQIPSGTDTRSPTRLQIPTRPQFGNDFIPIASALTNDDDDIIIDTPALPNTPAAFARQRPLLRPSLATPAPASPWRFKQQQSPYPWHHHDGFGSGSHSSVFGGGAAMTPITPFDEDGGGWSSTPIEQKAPPQWFWRHEPTLGVLEEVIVEEDEGGEEEEEEKGALPELLQSMATSAVQRGKAVESRRVSGFEMGVEQTGRGEVVVRGAFEEELGGVPEEGLGETPEEELEEAPEEALGMSPLTNDWADLAEVLGGLKVRPGSAFDFKSSDRPGSPKSRNMSRSSSAFHLFQPSELSYGEREQNAWGALDSDATSNVWAESERDGDAFARPSSRAGHRSVQRSNSFDEVGGWNSNAERTTGGRHQPSRLRHAFSFADEADEDDDRPDYDSEPDLNHHIPSRATHPSTHPRQHETSTQYPPNLEEVSPKSNPSTSFSRPRQQQQQPRNPAKQQPSPLSINMTEPPRPLSIDIQNAAIATPSLCSATSATSATSVSTFDDVNPGHPGVDLDLDLVTTMERVSAGCTAVDQDVIFGDYGGVGEKTVAFFPGLTAVGGGSGKGVVGSDEGEVWLGREVGRGDIGYAE